MYVCELVHMNVLMHICVYSELEWKLTKLQTTHTSPYDDHDGSEEIEIRDIV